MEGRCSLKRYVRCGKKLFVEKRCFIEKRISLLKRGVRCGNQMFVEESCPLWKEDVC